MHVFLWVLQAFLALFLLSGGPYKIASRDALAKQYAPLASGAWAALGVFEIVAGLLLILPAATGWMAFLTPLAAVVITLEALVLVGVFGRVSRTFSASNPLMFAGGMMLAAAVIAYGRLVLSPLA